jgi:hypothetical protein
MKRLATFLVLLLCFAATTGAGGPRKALVAVNDPRPGAAAVLLGAGIQVVRDMDRYLLAIVPDSDLADLDALGVDWTILDTPAEGRTYYTVSVSDPAALARLRSLARVVRADGHDAVVAMPEERAPRVVAAGFEIARVFERPIRLPRERFAPVAKTLVADPLIQTMVDEVVGASVDSYVQRLQNFVTRYCTTDSCQAAANWIKAKFESFGITDVSFQTIPGGYKPNVVATIPGTGDPSKIVVIGAHYDSYAQTNNAPGADDNASGTACVIEAARILSQYEFNYTITFVAFGAEELGLYGSEEFASQAAAAGDDILAAVCVDMIGYVAGGDAVDLDIIDNASSLWVRNLAFQSAVDYVPGFTTVDGSLPGGASSDHASFWANGYDAILLFEDTNQYSPYIHTTSDLVGTSYNSPTLARNSVKTAVGLVATLAEPFRLGIAHTPLGDTEDSSNPYRVVATLRAAGTLNPDSLLVRFDAGAGSQTLTMTPTGIADEYEAYIPAQPQGTFVDYYLIAEDMTGYRKTEPPDAPASVHTFFVGALTVFFSDTFETNLGWTAGVTGDNATSGQWQRGDPQGTTTGGSQVQPEDDHTAAPGVNCFATGLSAGSGPGSYDVDGGKTTLLSPVFDLSGTTIAFVSYWRWYTNNLGSAPGEDVWQVQATSDGTNWVDLENTTSSQNSWTEHIFALHDFIDLTASVRIRFIASDYGSGSLVEAAVDDFAISIWDLSFVGLDEGAGIPAPVTLAQNAPNPFNPMTAIRFSVPAPGRNVTLRLFDVSGREIRTLLRDEKVSGARTVTWDGLDGTGRPAASGVYIYRLDAGRQILSRKLVLTR